MKNTITLTMLIVSSLLMACNTQSSNQIKLQESLINKLIDSSEGVNFSNRDDKIIILKTKYCIEYDCEVYFQEYKERIQIYTNEEAFMRGIANYIEIEKVDEENGQLIYWKRAKDKYDRIELN